MEPYYSDDLVTLYHGDCREATAWLDARARHRPPLRHRVRIRWAQPRSRAGQGQHRGDSGPELRDEALARWGKRPAVVFGSWRVPRPDGVKNRLIWHKAANCPGPQSVPWYSADEEIYILGKGFVGKRSRTSSSPMTVVPRSAVRSPRSATRRRSRSDCSNGSSSSARPASSLTRSPGSAHGPQPRSPSDGVEIEERYCATTAGSAGLNLGGARDRPGPPGGAAETRPRPGHHPRCAPAPLGLPLVSLHVDRSGVVADVRPLRPGLKGEAP
jgi:hypothetical protein